MGSENKVKKGFSRRNFLKGSIATAAGIATSGVLAGCSGKDTAKSGGSAASGRPSWEVAPAPISDSAIKETVNTEVVILGAGFAGMCACVSAAQAGAKVVLLEKTAYMQFRGYDYAAINSKAQKSVGNKIDGTQVVREIMRWGAYKGDQRVIAQFVKHSGEANDWLLKMAVDLGCKYTVWKPSDMLTPTATFPPIPTLTFVLDPPAEALEVMPKGTLPPTAGMAWTLLKNAQKLGVDIRFATPAVQLIRPKNKGRVTGIIAQKEDGSYIKFNAAKGVILCTGDYGGDKEMLRKYIPSSEYIQGSGYPGTFNTGDGHKMGMWIGAALDELPHAPMYFDIGMMEAPGLADSIMRQPWLSVNERGERYANEDLPYAYISNAVRQQPGHTRWTVWDSKWPKEAPRFNQTACKSLKSLFHDPKKVEDYIQKGVIKSAGTVEELAAKMKMPVETFKATVARYNELVKKGVDEDFSKRRECLTTIDKPPLYACHLATVLLVTLGGLKINYKLQVLDTDLNVIPGLYAAGNTSGSYYANDYPVQMPGNSHGRAYTFGYLAGKNIVKLG